MIGFTDEVVEFIVLINLEAIISPLYTQCILVYICKRQ